LDVIPIFVVYDLGVVISTSTFAPLVRTEHLQEHLFAFSLIALTVGIATYYFLIIVVEKPLSEWRQRKLWQTAQAEFASRFGIVAAVEANETKSDVVRTFIAAVGAAAFALIFMTAHVLFYIYPWP
jgi:hypothetical protein